MSQKEITRLKNLLVKSNKANEELKKQNDVLSGKATNELFIFKEVGEENKKLKEENEKLTLDFQNYKFDANKKHDDLMILNQNLSKQTGDRVKNKALLKRIAELDEEIKHILDDKEENEEEKFQQGYDAGREEHQVDQEFLDEKDEEIENLKEAIASRDKYVKLIHQLALNFHKEKCGDNITLDYIKGEIGMGQVGAPEYREFMPFFYYIKDMLENIEEIKNANGEIFKKGYDNGREEILYQKNSEIEKLEEEIKKLNEQAYYHCEEIKEIREKNIELKKEACEKEEGTQAIILKLKEEIDTMRKTLYKIQGR